MEMKDARAPFALAGYEDYVHLMAPRYEPGGLQLFQVHVEKGPADVEHSRQLADILPLLRQDTGNLDPHGMRKRVEQISESGKAIKFYELRHFQIQLTPALLEKLSGEIPLAENRIKTGTDIRAHRRSPASNEL